MDGKGDRPIESKVITLATRPVAHQNATINDIIKKKLAILNHDGREIPSTSVDYKKDKETGRGVLNLDANVLKPQNTNRPPNRHEEMYPKGNESAG
jgi:hypothetical protein